MKVHLSIKLLLACILGLCGSSSGKHVTLNHAMQHRICKTPGCIDAARSISQNMDKSVSPCDNFYKFACGNYMRSQENFTGNVASEIDTKLDLQLKESIENKIDENDCRTLQLLKSHYFTCLNDESVERTSMEQFLDILKQLGGWPVLNGESWNESEFDWKDLMYQLRRTGYKKSMNSFLKLDLEYRKNVIILDHADTAFSKVQLIQSLQFEPVRAYYEYSVNISTALGADKQYAEKEMMEALAFEFEIAMMAVLKSYNDIRIEARELESEYSDIPWMDYINTLLWPNHVINSTENIALKKNFLKDLGELISKTPKRVLANYAIWQFVQESIPFMPNEIQKIKANFNLQAYDKKDQPARWQQCLKHLQDNMPLAVGALYVRKNFDPNLKKEGKKLVNYVHQSFKDSLEKLEWMDKKTKRAALKKLKALYSHVAYPDELLDDDIIDEYFENLKLIPDNYLDSYLSMGLFRMDKMYQQIGKSFDKTSWIAHGLHSATSLIHYNWIENSFTFPAAPFQEMFAIDRPNYLNYGMMGYIVGHEMTHAFDNFGSRFDEDGNMANWWDDKTLKEFKNRTFCLIRQYNNYTIEPLGKHVDGIQTLGENIADNGGLKQAYLAYEEYEKQNGAEPRLPGLSFSPRQLFWLNTANYYCEKYSFELLKVLHNVDDHPIGQFRVIGTLSNMPQFASDFECPLGSPMNPVEKCTIW